MVEALYLSLQVDMVLVESLSLQVEFGVTPALRLQLPQLPLRVRLRERQDRVGQIPLRDVHRRWDR